MIAPVPGHADVADDQHIYDVMPLLLDSILVTQPDAMQEGLLEDQRP